MGIKVVGADLGNDSHKIVFGPRQHFRIKNAVSQRMSGEVRKNLNIEPLHIEGGIHDIDDTSRGQIFKDLDVEIRSKQINGRYFVGDLASKHGENEIETGTTKADNPTLIIPLVTMLALDVPSTQHVGHYKVVCGLPITEFTEDKERYRQMLLGTYDVTFKTSALKDRSVKIIIEDVYVIPEGVAVILNQMLNEKADGFRNPSLRKGQRGVIDIGAFTTDIPVIVDGKPDSDASEGFAEGIANYLDKIVRFVNETYGVHMSRSQLVDRLENGELNVPIKGKPVDLKPFVEEQFQIFANKIVSKVDNLWANHFEIQEFYVVGGGAKALKRFLAAEMDKRKIGLTFIENEDPQLQNALGYWKFAKQKFGG